MRYVGYTSCHQKDLFQMVTLNIPIMKAKDIRIFHECEVLIEKSVLRVTVRHHSAEPRDAKL